MRVVTLNLQDLLAYMVIIVHASQSINGLGWSIAKLLGRVSRGPCNAMVKGRTQLLYAMFDGELVLTLNSSGSPFSEVPILAS